MYGYIYKTINLINNKIYVGKKKSDVFLKEQYLGSGKYITNAINKYGKENFSVELIDSAETLEELNEKEIYWINYFDARNSNIGYNIAPGGDGGCVWGEKENHPSKHTDRKGIKNPFFGKHHSDDTKNKIKTTWKIKTENGYVNSLKGMVRIRKEGIIKYCTKDEIDLYVNNGWSCYFLEEQKKQQLRDEGKLLPGMTGKHQSEYAKIQASKTHKGKIISSEQIEKFKATCMSRTEEEKILIHNHYSESQKKLCWVVNESGDVLRINKDNLDSYILKGYQRGRIFKNIDS